MRAHHKRKEALKQSSKPVAKPTQRMRKLLLKDDDDVKDSEWTNSNEVGNFCVVVNVKPKDVDEIQISLWEHGGLSGFQYMKYKKMNEDDQRKI